VQVAGVTAEEARSRVERALRANATQPQVLLTVIGQNSHAASVGGDVGRPGPVPLSPRGDTVLDVVASAGGSKFQAYETVVRIHRKQQTASMPLKAIVDNPSENIFVMPGDSLFLMKRAQSFSAFGATGKAGHYPFDADEVLLSEAVAKAGGLVDNQADVSGVLLFRYETGESLADLHPRYGYQPDKVYPTVYRIDWRTAKGILFGRRIHIHDKDVVMIANSDGAQLLKFFTLLKGASGILKDFNLVGTSTTSTSN
jgi:polysaccharide biosynthesis/export protein